MATILCQTNVIHSQPCYFQMFSILDRPGDGSAGCQGV